MSSIATPDAPVELAVDRLDVLFEELGQLMGQRNAIDGRIVDIVAEMEQRNMLGITGARSIAALVAWKTGSSERNARRIAAIAHRAAQFPRCMAGLREGRLSLDQVGIIAEKAGDGSDEHYVTLAEVATVNQLNTALKLEPPLPPEPDPWRNPDLDPEPDRAPEPPPPASISKTSDEQSTTWRITLPHIEAAKFDAALASHQDALIAEWKRDHDNDDSAEHRPPFPTLPQAFLSLVDAAWDADVSRRPHGQHTTVVVHLDVTEHIANLHLGPLLSDADRRYLTCDATCEAWFERDGHVLGAGRATRTVNRRLRRALEHRHPTCAVPGCSATRGLHAHHLLHWEDGGPTELDNLVLICPYHHRAHHRGAITITGPAHQLRVTDHTGRELSNTSLARPPNKPPPDVPPYRGPLGERADWWYYDPYEPPPPNGN